MLDLLLNRGPPALAIVLFAAALGLPIPSTALVLAAGALAREGRVDAPLYAILALIGAVLGDAAGYLLARLGFAPILRRLEGSTSWHRAERAFERWGKLTILFSRFLVTPLSPPVNAIAGAVRYPFAGFFLLCAIGEVVWVALFGGLGYFRRGLAGDRADRWRPQLVARRRRRCSPRLLRSLQVLAPPPCLHPALAYGPTDAPGSGVKRSVEGRGNQAVTRKDFEPTAPDPRSV
ncbi:MAG: VTT domain-containing protein [Actinomycetota bacterium]|nr:VTT domain-containing protein [Actinomycetota bacterium]